KRRATRCGEPHSRRGTQRRAVSPPARRRDELARDLSPVWVPDAHHESLRDLVRAREAAKRMSCALGTG
ncbi:MAG TPA: hypothetical protein VFR92_10260, partial [Sphingomicrobium sp.]|nr:hypothetical protein [Sphingomicrobium sp.]